MLNHYYRWARNGTLPRAGGWMDQPAKFTAAVPIIEAEIAKVKASQEKAADMSARPGSLGGLL